MRRILEAIAFLVLVGVACGLVYEHTGASVTRELVEEELFAQTIARNGTRLWVDVVVVKKMDRPLSPSAVRYVYGIVDNRIELLEEIPGEYIPGEIVRTSAEIRFARGSR